MIIKTKKSLNQLYNIGSKEEIKIYDLAKKIADYLNKKKIKIIKKKDINNSPLKRLPSIKKAKKKFQNISLNIILIEVLKLRLIGILKITFQLLIKKKQYDSSK